MHRRQVFSSNQNILPHRNLHRNFIWAIQPIEAISPVNAEFGRHILHRMRRPNGSFHRSRTCTKSSTMSLSGNLGSRETRSEPAMSRVHFPPMTATSSTLPTTPATRFSADDVASVADKLSECDPEKIPEINGYPVKLCMPVVYRENYKDNELKNIVSKLHEYDPERYPPDHMGVALKVLTALPKQTMIKMKKCSAGQVEDIVEKLYKFDFSSSPPETRIGYGSRCHLESRLSMNSGWKLQTSSQTKYWQPESAKFKLRPINV